MSWGPASPRGGVVDAMGTIRSFRVTCELTKKTLGGASKFSDVLETVLDAERRLARSSRGDVEARARADRAARSAVASLREASERATKKLENWLAASRTKRLMGYDGNVKTALGDLAARASDAAEALREPPTSASSSDDSDADAADADAADADDRRRGASPPPSAQRRGASPPPPPSARRAPASPSSSPPRRPTARADAPGERASGIALASGAPPSRPATDPAPPAPALLESLALGPPSSLSSSVGLLDHPPLPRTIPSTYATNGPADAKYASALRAAEEGNAQFADAFMVEAAEAGHAAAAASVAPRLAARGDLASAARCFALAADAGDAESANEIGVLLLRGDEAETGVRRDAAEAARYFGVAAAGHSGAGAYNLGGCRERGEGLPRDVAKAREAYERALSLGVQKARLALGYLASYEGDYPTAAAHFGAVVAASDAPGRLEAAGLTRRDAADATHCLAHAHEMAAEIGRRRAKQMLETPTIAESVAYDPSTSSRPEESDPDPDAADVRDAARRAAARLAASRVAGARPTAAELRGDALAAEAEARALYRRAADAGDPRASFRVGLDQWAAARALEAEAKDDERRRKDPDPERALAAKEAAMERVVEAAAVGFGPAWRWLAEVAASGEGGGAPDPATARRLMENAHACGDAEATRALAVMEEKAHREAAERGEAMLLPTAPPKAWRPGVPPGIVEGGAPGGE